MTREYVVCDCGKRVYFSLKTGWICDNCGQEPPFESLIEVESEPNEKDFD